MKDHCRILRCSVAILTGQQIARDYLNPYRIASSSREGLDPGRTEGAGKTAYVTKAATHEVCYQSGPDEPRCACYEDKIVSLCDKVFPPTVAHISSVNR